MITHRLLPPINVAQQSMVVNDRSYTGQPGMAVDVQVIDSIHLEANGWIYIARSGPTSDRPKPKADGTIDVASSGPGDRYFDTTIGALIVCDGQTWRSPVDGSEV